MPGRRGWAIAAAILWVALATGCGVLYAPPGSGYSGRDTLATATAGPQATPAPTTAPQPSDTLPAPPSATAPTVASATASATLPAPATATPTRMLLASATAAPAAIPLTAALSLDDFPMPPILLQGSGPEVYQIVQGQRRHIADMDTFTHLGYRPEDILVSEYLLSAYPDGPPITRLLQGEDGGVYWMVDGVRHPIPDAGTLAALQAAGPELSPAPEALLRSFPLGAPHSAASSGPPPVEPLPVAERVAGAYHAIDGGPRLVELFTAGVDGSRPRRLTHGGGNAESFAPAWSPDGARIAYTYCADGSSGSCAVSLIPAEGGAPRPLAGPMTFDPVWSPDGGRIAYWSSRTLRVYVMDSDGANAREIAAGRGPAWTPEGRIAFWAGEKEPHALSVIDAAGGAAQVVAGRVEVYDQRYHPWRVAAWAAEGDPWSPGGRSD